MKPIDVRATLGAHLALVLLLGSASTVSGQTAFSVAGGLTVASSVLSQYPWISGSSIGGFAVQASVGRRYHGRLGWRIDAFGNQFAVTEPTDFAGVLCVQHPPPGTCCGICPRSSTTGHVGVAGMAVNQFVTVTPAALPIGMYIIWGAETDYLYQHPSAQGALRLGASAGGGVTLPLAGQMAAFVEARYHHLFDAPSEPSWLLPVTVGIRF
jgi:hypothetical protein